ncbi:MAG: transcriptional regulator [Prevotella sp.]|nr:transcriptional regulator [Prevotella sp.]
MSCPRHLSRKPSSLARFPQQTLPPNLSSAGYISKRTDGSGPKPRTICKMTDAGREAMREYVETLKTYFNGL